MLYAVCGAACDAYAGPALCNGSGAQDWSVGLIQSADRPVPLILPVEQDEFDTPVYLVLRYMACTYYGVTQTHASSISYERGR